MSRGLRSHCWGIIIKVELSQNRSFPATHPEVPATSPCSSQLHDLKYLKSKLGKPDVHARSSIVLGSVDREQVAIGRPGQLPWRSGCLVREKRVSALSIPELDGRVFSPASVLQITTRNISRSEIAPIRRPGAARQLSLDRLTGEDTPARAGITDLHTTGAVLVDQAGKALPSLDHTTGPPC